MKTEKFVKFVNFVRSCQIFSKSKSDATNGVDDTIFQIHENGRIKLVNSLWHIIWENVFSSRLKKIRQNVLRYDFSAKPYEKTCENAVCQKSSMESDVEFYQIRKNR